ncbi:hypothetical protein LPB136_06610 [Tenacibaculum todarodis]|uniref:Polysialic acid transporter n=1 Tax=Tenacibaculum todarodis TaxID=1850252 RepID=A0A1L3JIU6_9FLAO|nr:SLBB domain-containing protein [Tenacibaculum todarodis]APG65048.1 hypothetical protein LPB136_06610 [Tenacibaculum todarodis]
MKRSQILFFLTIILFSISEISISQNINDISNVDKMSDSQVSAYWESAQEKGLTLNQLEQIASTKGISSADFLKFKQRVNSLQTKTVSTPNGTNSEEKNNPKQNEFGHSGSKSLENKVKSKHFGFDFFSNPNISFTPNLNLATPETYQLGPGDKLLIDIWGAAENSYSEKVSVDGSVRIKNIGPVYVSGLSIKDAKAKIISSLKKIYGGIISSNSSYNKINVDVALTSVRTVQVNIIGEVKVPGTYSLSALSSVLNALYASGGPTTNGTFRDVKIFRDGKQLANFDIYKYLTEGKQEGNVLVRDQDIIIVSPYVNRIFVEGQVKRPGAYEFKEGEVLKDLITYFGGFKSDAYKEIITVNRVNGSQREISEINLKNVNNFKLKDGDRFEVKGVIDRFENRVSIEGAVYRPGDFELTPNLTVADIIKKAAGVKDNAFLNRGIIYRSKDGVKQEVKSFSVKEVLNNIGNIKLQREDRVHIFSTNELQEEYTISIDGAVNKPQTIKFVENMQIEDLIAISGGFKEGADSSSIDISRRSNDGTFKTISKNIRLSTSSNLTSDNKEAVFLEPFDRVSVRFIKGFTVQKSVSVVGEANYPGRYALENKEERISDLLEKAGGVSPYAYVKGATLIRSSGGDVSKDSQNSAVNNLNTKQDSIVLTKSGNNRIGIDLEQIIKKKKSKFDLILKAGDKLFIPSVKQTVEVQGEVLSPAVIRFDKGNSLKDYINSAGGFSANARKGNTYVVYANGEIKSTKKFLFFKSYPKLEPGALILVPHKTSGKNSLSTQEIIGITTSLATLGVLINTLVK